jgi:hypothetical protein
MALSGNITTIVPDSKDLETRFPILNRYLPKNQENWGDQITAGQKEALRVFRLAKSQDPEYAKAEADDDWKMIVCSFTLWIILRGFVQDEFRALAREWREDGLKQVNDFLYRYDADLDGVLDDNAVTEAAQRVGEVILQR